MLVDSDVVIWYLRANEKAAQFLNDLTDFEVSAVSYMELVQGCRNEQELERLEIVYGCAVRFRVFRFSCVPGSSH